MSNKIHESINELIPYISENFITYPLWEEGKYIPFVNFWQIARNADERIMLLNRIRKLDSNPDYCIGINLNESNKTCLVCSVSPDFVEMEDGGYEFVNPHWSIEVMILLVKEFLNIKYEKRKIVF